MRCLLTLLFASLLLSGCSSWQKPPVQVSEAKLYLQGDPLSLDPRIGYDRRSQQVVRELFEGLTRIGRDGLPHLALAQSVRVSEDGRVYTFHLSPTLWSNGIEVVADDFVYSWKSSIDPSASNARSDGLFIIKNAKRARSGECSLDCVGIRAIDRSTLEVTLEHPVPYFLELLANPIFSPLCRSVVEKDPCFDTSENFVCNGPFCLKERRLKSHIILEKNPRYWNPEKACVDRISFAIIEDPQTAYNMFLSGNLDWHGEPCGNISFEMVSELCRKKKLSSHQVGASYQLLCRITAPPLQSLKIRSAIAHALNRQEICDKILQGGETPAFSLSPPFLSYLSERPYTDNDVEKARILFAEGLEEESLTPATYPPLTLSYFADPSIKPMMEAVQDQLQSALPIKVHLDPCDRGTYLKKVYSGNYELMNLSLNLWFNDPSANLDIFKFQKSTLNGTGWENAEYIRLLDQAEAAVNSEERQRLFAKAERLLMKSLPCIPICYQTLKYVKSTHLTGEVLSPVGIMELKWLEKVGGV